MPALHTLALKDVFVPHGSIPALRKAYHIDYDDLFSQLAWTRQKQE